MKREELVERAAAAIARATIEAGAPEDAPEVQQYMVDNLSVKFLPEARAALTAILEGLREPSEEMLAAGCVGLNNGGIDDVENRDAGWCWQAMLAALEE